MTTHKFEIKAPVNSMEASITLDGKPLDGVVRVSFDLNAEGPTILKLEIIGEVIVDGEFRESAILQMAQANPEKSP